MIHVNNFSPSCQAPDKIRTYGLPRPGTRVFVLSVLYFLTPRRNFNFFSTTSFCQWDCNLSGLYLIQYIENQQLNCIILLLVLYTSYLKPHLPNIEHKLCHPKSHFCFQIRDPEIRLIRLCKAIYHLIG